MDNLEKFFSNLYNLEQWNDESIVDKLKANNCDFNNTLEDIIKDKKMKNKIVIYGIKYIV